MIKGYLASPFFNENELFIYKEVISILRNNKNIDLYVPMEHKIPGAYDISNQEWGRRVFEMDIKAMDDCDVVIVLNYGMYSDTGTAWETGYAFAKGKDIYQVLCMDNKTDYSIMMINGSGTVMTLEDLRDRNIPIQNNVLDSINQK